MIAAMSTTMIKQVVRHNNLSLLLKTSSQMQPGLLKNTFEALLPFASTLESSSADIKTNPHPQKKLDRAFYLMFYELCCKLDNYDWQNAGQYPLDLNQPILSPQATLHISLPWNKTRISISKHHEGNSLVQVNSPLYGRKHFGSIFIIFTHTRADNQYSKTESYVGINIFPDLSAKDSACSPYHSHIFSQSNIHLQYEKDLSNVLVCRTTNIISHVAIHRKVPGTYGITKGTVAIADLDDITVS